MRPVDDYACKKSGQKKTYFQNCLSCACHRISILCVSRFFYTSMAWNYQGSRSESHDWIVLMLIQSRSWSNWERSSFIQLDSNAHLYYALWVQESQLSQNIDFVCIDILLHQYGMTLSRFVFWKSRMNVLMLIQSRSWSNWESSSFIQLDSNAHLYNVLWVQESHLSQNIDLVCIDILLHKYGMELSRLVFWKSQLDRANVDPIP